jgi:hypothetical protein
MYGRWEDVGDGFQKEQTLEVQGIKEYPECSLSTHSYISMARIITIMHSITFSYNLLYKYFQNLLPMYVHKTSLS